MGVLDLQEIVWPSDSTYSGSDMDILARRHLFAVGKDYKHGTGHGVGTFLNVHEGPQGISRASKVKLVTGMCVSNEPGYYEEGEYGIRIENVMMCVPHKKLPNFFSWENLTVAPYCRELIEKNLLSPQMISIIDQHH